MGTSQLVARDSAATGSFLSYVPAIGRFISIDPVPEGSANPYDHANRPCQWVGSKWDEALCQSV
jgi:hypothetical protein